MKNWISRICLAVALIITVYNFFIIDKPDAQGTGIILLLLIVANVQTMTNKGWKNAFAIWQTLFNWNEPFISWLIYEYLPRIREHSTLIRK